MHVRRTVEVGVQASQGWIKKSRGSIVDQDNANTVIGPQAESLKNITVPELESGVVCSEYATRQTNY